MSEFKKRFQIKRILAAFLAVIMVVTMVPPSAVYAAQDTADLESTVTTEGEDTQDIDTGGDIDTDDAFSGAEDVDTVDTPAAEGEDAAGISDALPVEVEPETDSADAEPADGDNTGTTDPAPVPEIVKLGGETTKEYTGSSLFKVNEYVQVKNGAATSTLTASKDYDYKWQKQGADSQYADITGNPTDAGNYKLVLTATDAAKAAGAKDDEIAFVITPAKLILKADTIIVPPGTTKAQLESTKSEDIAFEIKDASSNAALRIAKANDRIKELITLTVQPGTLVNAIDSTAVVPDPLKRSDEYLVDVKAAFSAGETDEDKILIGNFDVAQTLKVNVKAEELVETEVVWEPKKEGLPAGASWYEEEGEDGEKHWVLKIKTYDGSPAAESLVDQSYDVKVQEANADPAVDVTVNTATDKLEGKYFEYVNEKWVDESGEEHNNWIWKEMAAPSDAGRYTYRVTYTSDGDVYNESFGEIFVEIEPAQIVLVPKKASTSSVIKEHMTVKDVLNLFDYDVYDVKDGVRSTSAKTIDRDHFWGKSYDDTGATQPYAPVFYLEAAPKDTTNWTQCKDDDTLSVANDYRVIFSGYKAVYNADGSFVYNVDGTIAHLVEINTNDDINGPDTNYAVDTKQETWASDAYAIKSADIQPATAVTIETDKIRTREDGTALGGETIESAPKHIYDPNTALYTARDQYKKAYLKDASGTNAPIEGTDPAFHYTWYEAKYPGNNIIPGNDYTDGLVDITDYELWKANKAADDTSTFEDQVRWSRINESASMTLYRAGIYKLEITYDNSDNGYYAAKATVPVYYVIRQREIKAELTAPAEGLKVMSETTVEEFLDKLRHNEITIEKKIFDVTDNRHNELTNWQEDKDYSIRWKVVQTVTSDTDPAQKEEIELDEWDTFEADGVYALKIANLYFLDNVECEASRSDERNNTAYRFSVNPANPEDPENPTTKATRKTVFLSEDQSLPIGIDKMGTEQITIVADATKLASKSKVYDGEVFHIEGDSEVDPNPFTEDFSKALDAGLIKIQKADGTEVPTTEIDPRTDLVYEYYDKETGSYLNDIYAKNVGTYILKASYKGDTDKYHSCAPFDIAEVEITPRELKIDASKVLGNVEAGTYASIVNNTINYSELLIDGYAPKDKYAFTYRFNAWYGWDNDGSSPLLTVYEKENTYTGRLKNSGNYYLKYTGEFRDEADGNTDGLYTENPYARNYTVKCEPVKINVVRGHASVSVYDIPAKYSEYDPDDERELKYYDTWVAQKPDTSEQDWKYTLNIQEDIQYETRYPFKEEILEGNLVEVWISAPREYEKSIPDTAVYRSQIEAQGGHILRDDENAIVVVFDAREGTKQFNILWEQGHTDTFVLDFDDAKAKNLLLPNLEDAVVPKSLAFNAVNKKMVVGQTQQLDVKLSKKQMDDVVCLEYRISEDSSAGILAVDKETGLVTALGTGGQAKATATVEVYPVHLVKGVKTAFDASEKPKTAKVKITVTDVAAPKITSVKALDKTAEIRYTAPEEGFRREVYVLDLSNETGKLKEKDVEKKFIDAIASMKDENWEGIFAIAPQYYGIADEERLIEYNGSAIARLSGLKTFTQYAVYVRNVSGIRTLSDGSQVTRSEKGAVKLFQTTRTQLLSLRKDIRRRNVPNTVYGPTGNVCELVYTPRIGFNQSETNVDYFDQGVKREWYRVNLSQGSVYIFTEAQFPDVSAAAEARDKEWKLLPLSPQDLGLYADPNLSYTAYVENKEGQWDVTDLIKVDSQGKITLKGVGEFYIHIKNGSGCACGAGDATTENCEKCAYLPLRVTADVDSIVPKKNNIQLQVGESARLVDLLNYKVGKKVVKGYNELAEVYADDTLRAAIEQNGCFKLNASGDRITAVKEGTLSSVTLKESSLNLTSTPFTLTAKLDAVKSLKVNHIIDDRLQIEFIRPDYKFGKKAYEISGNNDDRVGYRIEIKDTRGVTRNEVRWDNSWFNAKDKKWHCRYDITGLTQQSQYTISVYTIFRNEVSAKAATKKVKTTKLAIRDSYLEGNWTEGGLTVSVSEAISAEGKHAPILEAYGENAFTSGNIYTLTASAQSGRTRAKMTDTLKWSSTNSKVASVKAGGGTFSASLKALKPGTAVIEARSKIWKNRVVARYTVTVYALGDAYKNTNRYFDQNEPKDPNESDEPYTPGSIKLPLSAGEKRKVSVGERKTFTFTVPEAGKYSFHSYGSTMYVNVEIWKGNSHIENLYGSSVDKELGWLKAGDKYTFIINHVEPDNGNYKTETACFVGITLDQKVWPVTNGKLEINDAERYQEYFRYKADADGYYRFIAPNGEDGNYDIGLFKNETDMVNGDSFALGNNGWYFMEAGEEVYGYVNIGIGNSTTLTVTKNVELKAGTPTNVSITGGEYIYFKADADGYYQFYSTDADANITAQFTLESGTFSSSREDKNFYLNCELKAGDEGYLKVTTASLGTPAPTVNVKKTGQELTATEGAADNKATVSLAPGKDSEQYVSFSAPKNGYYHFYTAGAKDSDKVRLEVIGGDNGSDVYYEMKAGEKVWVKITSSPAEKVDIELHVKDETPEAITAGAEATAVPANTKIIRSFTASEDGCYEFTISGESYNGRLSLYANILDAQDEQSPIATCSTTGDTAPYTGTIRRVMKAGATILLAAENEGEAALSVAVSKVDNKDSFTTDETAELTLTADENGWKCFTADQTGLYTFTFKPNTSYIYAGLVKNYSSSDPEYVVGQNTVYTSGWTTDPYAMEAGEAIWLYAENPVSSEVKVTLSAKRDGEFAVLSQDAEPQMLAVSSNKEQWARFTAKQGGVYSFKFSPDDGYVYGYLYDRYGDTSYTQYQSSTRRNQEFILCRWLDAEDSVWVRTRNTSSSSVDVGLSVSLRPRLSISEGSVKTVELLPDEAEWIRFTASQSGIYRFTYDYKGSLQYGQTHEYGSTSYDSSSIYGLSAGESAWMYVRNTDSAALSVDLKVEFQEEAYIELGKDQVLTGQGSVSKWVQFTAPSNGTYIFKASAPECKLNSNLCRKYQDDYISNASNKAESAELAAYLTEGDSVWFSGYAEAESYSDDITLTLNVSQKTPVTLSVGESVYKIYSQTAEWAYFKADQEGLYHFEISVESEYNQGVYCGLCETEGKNEYISGTKGYIYSYNNTPHKASLYMQSGDEVWLYTKSDSYDAQITANITMENPNLTADENGNLSKTVDLNNTTNQKLWTRFTATEAGTYAFKFEASSSIQSMLCETYTTDSPTGIAYPDGSNGSYFNDSTTKTVFYYAMESGDSVWLYAYNSSSNNTVTVSVTKEDRETSVGATDFTNGEQKIALPGYEVKLLKFKADKAGKYSFKFTRNSGYSNYLLGGLRASDNIYNSTSTENWSNIGTDYFTSLSSPATYSWEASQEGDIIWLWVQNRYSDDSEVTIEVTAPKDTEDPTS